MLEIVTQVKSPLWDKVPSLSEIIENTIMQTNNNINYLPDNNEICCSVILASDEFIKDLNCKYRDKDQATNVLSFANYNFKNGDVVDFDHEIELGDIIISYETLVAEAQERNIDFISHFKHILIHGFLHLIGFDHQLSDDAEEMEEKEIAILAQMGISNPYFL